MVFKSDWEKTDERVKLDKRIIEKAIADALPGQEVRSYQVISGGCANLNIRVDLKSQLSFILRFYLRDEEAVLREQNIYQMVGDQIPVPEVLYTGSVGQYQYALIKFIDGITLRDAIRNEPIKELSGAIYETGVLLVKCQNYSFSSSGFFDEKLNIQNKLGESFCTNFWGKCLEAEQVSSQLDKNTINKLLKIVQKYEAYFPDGTEASLVHADYDPSNILVRKNNGKWVVSAILDWEFSFAGSYLCDVANMLRYAHQLPKIYEQSFLEGLQSTGLLLPDGWRITMYLLNLLSLLDCLVNSDNSMPNKIKDIKDLINYFVGELERCS